MRRRRVVIVGAGIGGLTSAVGIAAAGFDVTVVERAAQPGGKLREVTVGGVQIDSGPTVFTMRWVFEQIFADAGADLGAHLALRPVEMLARHAWTETERLDLFADVRRSADAIGTFAGATEARGYLDFSARARRIYETLVDPYIRAARPSPVGLVRGIGLGRLEDLWQITPFTTLWAALGQHFKDQRLRQLFGRYATYCGSSPFQASATLMLIAHVEAEGVWLVDGGMHAIAKALCELATRHGAVFRYGADVQDILVTNGRASGVVLGDGERLDADAVVFNGDVSALGTGRLGPAVQRACPAVAPQARSLSALTLSLVADTDGFPLSHHSVFFSNDYQAEFDDIFRHQRLPTKPTVYVCAQDRGGGDGDAPSGSERLFMIINAPANGDIQRPDKVEIELCEQRTFQLLERCGLHMRVHPEHKVVTAPADFERLFPATGGALYGRASHGWMASFSRPGARSRIPGLYLAGGSAHPGAGLPMAALSGWQASSSVQADLGSMSRLIPAAMPGGISMH